MTKERTLNKPISLFVDDDELILVHARLRNSSNAVALDVVAMV